MNRLIKSFRLWLPVAAIAVLAQVLLAQQATIITVAPVGAQSSLAGGNGNKVVVSSANVLHATFVDGQQIKYASSTDGVTWSLPVSVGPSGGARPTLAVSSDGTVGIAFVSNGAIRYVHKLPGGTWSTPLSISATGAKAGLSMVSLGNAMHLLWAESSVVSYARFPAKSGSAPQVEFVNSFPVCGQLTITYPSISVLPGSSAGSPPVVRAAWFESYFSSNCPRSPTNTFRFGYVFAQRSAGGLPWPTIFGGISEAGASNTGSVSLSTTANPLTGDFYVGLSYLWEGNEYTTLYYENAWDAKDTWRSTTLLLRRSLIDVHARPSRCSDIIVAVSDFTQGSNGYGPTWYREGRWKGPTALNPSWYASAPVQLSSSARDPQALAWEGRFGTIRRGYTRNVRAFFDDRTGSANFVRHHQIRYEGHFPARACEFAVTSL